MLEQLTRQAIRTAAPHQVIVVESNPAITYETRNTLTLHPEEPFNYNAYLNMGAAHSQADYLFFGNNDIVFEPGWDAALVAAMQKHQARSASPFCPHTHPKDFDIQYNSGTLAGYQVYKLFCGWAFMWERTLYEQLGGLNEDFNFWCSDNAAVEQVKALNENHILVTASVVQHVQGGSRTLIGLEDSLYHQYTREELRKFKSLYGQVIDLPEEDYPKAKFLKRPNS